MREAHICTTCLDIILEKKSFSDGRILDDLNGILDFVGKASKNDLDIFAKGEEIEASVFIQLEKNGWKKSNIVQELPNKPRADFLLRHQDKDLAIIEVKSPRNEPKAGLEQAINFGKQLNIDYVYATNGLEIYEYSIDKQEGNFIDKYPSPDELWKRYDTPQRRLRDYPYLNKHLERHHKEAIITIIEGIINDNKRILLSLVSEAGKHVVILEVLHKLYNARWYEDKIPRVLIIVNKNYTRYMERQFELLDKKNIDFITFRDIKTNYNDYDIVIIEEIPRARDKVARRDKWKELLHNSNNPIFINFTTFYQDKRKEDFGELKYSYSLDDSISDGLSRPYKVIAIDMKANNSRTVLKSFLDYIDSKEKTVIFCKNQAEIRFISESLYQSHININIITDSYDRFIVANLNNFRKAHHGIGIVSVNHLDIGFGNLDNIVFLTVIKSQYQLNNLLSESTRVDKYRHRKKVVKVIDFFFEEHKEYYNLELNEINSSNKAEDLEFFRREQSKKAKEEKLNRKKLEEKRKQQKREKQADSEWYFISNSQKIDELEAFVEKYSDTTYAKKAKQKIAEREDFLLNLSPVKRKLEELYENESNMPKWTFLLQCIEKGLFDFDKCEALKLLKEIMIFNNKWKEESQAKKPSKDNNYQKTLKVMEFLREC